MPSPVLNVYHLKGFARRDKAKSRKVSDLTNMVGGIAIASDQTCVTSKLHPGNLPTLVAFLRLHCLNCLIGKNTRPN